MSTSNMKSQKIIHKIKDLPDRFGKSFLELYYFEWKDLKDAEDMVCF
jgi:hypothetical protein